MSEMGKGNSGQQLSGEPGETYLAAPKLPGEGGLTLEPIRTDGPDSIDPTGIPEIKATRLRQLEITRDNCFHQVDVHLADDLFRCAAAEGSLSTTFPSTGTITAAVFAIEFADSPEPRRVIVCLPDTVLLERPSDAPIVFRWLDKCRLRLPRKLAHLLLLLTLSFTAAACPLVDDDDADEDEDDRDHKVLAFGL